jgi:hypothetical protein
LRESLLLPDVKASKINNDATTERFGKEIGKRRWTWHHVMFNLPREGVVSVFQQVKNEKAQNSPFSHWYCDNALSVTSPWAVPASQANHLPITVISSIRCDITRSEGIKTPNHAWF